MTPENAEQLFVAVVATLNTLSDKMARLALYHDKTHRNTGLRNIEYGPDAPFDGGLMEGGPVEAPAMFTKTPEELEKSNKQFWAEHSAIKDLLQDTITVLGQRNDKSLFQPSVLTKPLKDMTREEIVAAHRAMQASKHPKMRQLDENMKKAVEAREQKALHAAPAHDFEKDVVYSGGLPAMSGLANTFELEALLVLNRPDTDPAKQELLARGVTVETILKAREDRCQSLERNAEFEDAISKLIEREEGVKAAFAENLPTVARRGLERIEFINQHGKEGELEKDRENLLEMMKANHLSFVAPNTTSIEAGVAITLVEARDQIAEENPEARVQSIAVTRDNMDDLLEKAKSQ